MASDGVALCLSLSLSRLHQSRHGGLVARKTETSGIASNHRKRTAPTGRQRPMIRKAFTRDWDCAIDFRIV